MAEKTQAQINEEARQARSAATIAANDSSEQGSSDEAAKPAPAKPAPAKEKVGTGNSSFDMAGFIATVNAQIAAATDEGVIAKLKAKKARVIANAE